MDDDEEAEIVARYQEGQFLVLNTRRGGGEIVRDCWTGAYESALQAAEGFKKLLLDEEEEEDILDV